MELLNLILLPLLPANLWNLDLYIPYTGLYGPFGQVTIPYDGLPSVGKKVFGMFFQ